MKNKVVEDKKSQTAPIEVVLVNGLSGRRTAMTMRTKYVGVVMDRLNDGRIIGKTRSYKTWEGALLGAVKLDRRVGFGERSKISVMEITY